MPLALILSAGRVPLSLAGAVKGSAPVVREAVIRWSNATPRTGSLRLGLPDLPQRPLRHSALEQRAGRGACALVGRRAGEWGLGTVPPGRPGDGASLHRVRRLVGGRAEPASRRSRACHRGACGAFTRPLSPEQVLIWHGVCTHYLRQPISIANWRRASAGGRRSLAVSGH